MTPNAIAFYAVAVLIVLAAGAAVGLPSLRHAGYAGAALIVLMALLELICGAYALAVVQLVVPGVAAAIVAQVLRHETYRGLLAVPHAPERFWIAAPIAVGIAAVLVVTFVANGSAWYPDVLRNAATGTSAALVTVLHYRVPYALVISVVLVLASAGVGLVIGRRSADEQTLDEHLKQRREREALARRRREDREQGRRRPARGDS
jgi:lysylphosphatidylglycerol synthetase-like protein (DUF2156 family)